MRKWLALLGNNRFACIILDGGKMSRHFRLERGRPQGDVISPNTFNFVVQILIFKLELDPDIKKIPRPDPLRLNNNQHAIFMYESNRETGTNESLADDNTTITLLDLESLARVRHILDDFGVISGLRCNYDKSVIMPTYDISDPEKINVETLGFQFKDSITLLGVDINSKLNNIQEISQKIKQKIVSQIAFWERFRLTLPGRITILKTCLISQICYIGSFLLLDLEIVSEMQTLMDGFVKKNLKIIQDRIYLPPNLGGTGSIKLNKFLPALNLSWFNRATKLRIDNWRYDLAFNAPMQNPFLIRESDLNPSINPILFNMAVNYVNFYKNFSAINGNYKEAYIFNNQTFCFGQNNQELFNEDFLGRDFINRHFNLIRTLKFCDLFHGNRVKTRDEFEMDGLAFTAATWMRIQLAAISIKTRLRKADVTDNLCQNIDGFFGTVKKGARKFRSIFLKQQTDNADPTRLRIVGTFAAVTETAVPNLDTIRHALNSWNISFLHNDLKDFIFRFRNNQLFTNDRLHAIDGLTNPVCTFCRIKGLPGAPNESFYHLFFSCSTSKGFLNSFCARMEPVPDLNGNEGQLLYWYGSSNPDEADNDCKYVNFAFDCFRYILWKFKLRKNLPNANSFTREVEFLMRSSLRCNKTFKRKIEKINRLANVLPAPG